MRQLRGLLFCLLLSCNASTTSSDDDVSPDHLGVTLLVEPATLAVDFPEGGPAQTHRFTVTSPRIGDITDRVEWTLTNPKLGTLSGGELTLPAELTRGGQALLVATYRGGTGSALLRVKLLARAVVDPSAAPDPEGKFKEAPPGGPAPSVVYPLDQVLLPKNLGQMNLQWRGDGAQQLFRLTVDGPTYRQDLYVGASRCQQAGEARCQYPIADPLWLRVAESAAGAPLALQVAGLGGGKLGTSAPISLAFSSEDVRGGLYYFSTSQWGLLRLPFGGQRALPFLIGDRFSQTGSCIGCHVSTRDGKKLAALFGGGDGYGGIVDGTDPTVFLRRPQAKKDGMGSFRSDRVGQVWNFTSFSPDGSRLISTWAGRMELRDGATGDFLAEVPQQQLGGLATMPEWSPDGKQIVFVRIPKPFGRIGKELAPVVDFGELTAGDWLLVNAGDLALLPYNDGAFGPAQTLLAASERGEYHFYPSFSPDGRWLVFNSARHGQCGTDSGERQGVEIGPGNCTSYDQRNARLRLIAARAGGQPMELSRATVQADKTTSWPRFAPFQQDGGRLTFITYSAKLDYGFVLVQPGDPQRRQPQLWMAAVDLDRASRGTEDPSAAPFWLPFQEVAERNHQATWTHDVFCRTAAECGPGFDCLSDKCVPRIE